ncbi:MAG: phenylacetic acid degradation protein PaaD [Oceanospirillaceae bacterium]|nr:phenylacetic acid degradation protein PaaD [Oceanospirillaceae bacterium]MBT14001.1 phenylacetic acid degradation protein PaaD [Oceanospirillaceae bacterium]
MSATELAQACADELLRRDDASQYLGMKMTDVAPGEARMSMVVQEFMLQGHKTCHGGYLFTLADSAFAFACNTYNQATVAIGCSIDYVAPAYAGDHLTASARERSRSGRTGNYDVEIRNQDGALIAMFHGRSYRIRGDILPQENADD